MSFIVKKLELDLKIDLTAYIPEFEGGILTTEKTDGESLNEWSKMTIAEGSRIENLRKNYDDNDEDSLSLSDIALEAINSTKIQIDYFYDKGIEFYNPIPHSILTSVLTYLHEQINPAKKKLRNYKK